MPLLLAMTPDQVTALTKLLPSGTSPMDYINGQLIVPDGTLTTQVQAIIANANWQAGAAKAQLIAYAQAKQAAIAKGGITVNIGSSGAPENVEASTDAYSLAILNAAAAAASANAQATTPWVPETGSPVTLTAAQVLALSTAVNAFIQSTFATLLAVVNAVNAGTITTIAQVDTPPAPTPAWPVNS